MWKTVKLGEICEFVRGPFGGSLKKNIFVNDGYPVYEQQHAIRNQCSDFRYFIDDEKFREMQRFLVSPGDILMSCSGTIGRTTVVPKSAPLGIINQALLKITPSSKMDVEFLKYYMESPLFNDQLMENVDGAAIQNVASVKILKGILITYPPLAEQQRIVAKLDAAFSEIDRAIETKSDNLKALENLQYNILTETFLQASNDSQVELMSDCYDVRDGTHDSPKYCDEGYQLITSKNLKTGRLDRSSAKLISAEGYKNIIKRSKVDVGDVLMAMIGTIGNPVVITDEPDYAIKNVALFKVDNSKNDSDYLCYYLKCITPKLMKDAKGATQKFVGLGYLRQLEIPYKSLMEQREVSERLGLFEARIAECKDLLERQLSNYSALRSAILAQELQPREAA